MTPITLETTMVDKIPWDTCIIAWIICFLKTEFEKALLSFSKFVSAPAPPPHPGEMFNIVGGLGGGAEQV